METEKAIEDIKELLKYPKWYASTEKETDFLRGIDKSLIESVLKELEKKDKIIYLMAKQISTQDIDEDICIHEGICNENECIECIKQYFENKANEEENK